MKYKVKDSFEMKQIAEEYIVISRGSKALHFNATVVFNETGAFLWNQMAEFTDAETLAAALAAQYGTDSATALEDTKAFLAKMVQNGMAESVE